MRHFILVIICSLVFFNCSQKKESEANNRLVALGLLSSRTQTINTTTNPYLYVSITSHNEESLPDPAYDSLPGTTYLTYRSLTKSLVDTIYSKGAKFNYESDWRFLNAIKLYDTASVMIRTIRIFSAISRKTKALKQTHTHMRLQKIMRMLLIGYHNQALPPRIILAVSHTTPLLEMQLIGKSYKIL